MATRKLIPNPLLSADPATLPPQRKGTRKQNGSLLDYVRALKPGPPPFGWVDVTPYFGPGRHALGTYKLRCEQAGYLLASQIVTLNGQTYRRIAVALKSHHPTFSTR